jgi:MarR family transcriptional regulator, organic hydroperoxide resistance regulator
MERDVTKRLREELRQNKPFPSVGQEAMLALMRTVDELRRRAAGLLQPVDLSMEQYNVLRILRGAGPGGLPTLEIAGRMVERQPGMTRLLDKLEAKGLASRVRCKEDRRQVLCRLTEAGAALLGSLDAPIEESSQRSFGALSPEELEQLVGLLDRIRYPELYL